MWKLVWAVYQKQEKIRAHSVLYSHDKDTSYTCIPHVRINSGSICRSAASDPFLLATTTHSSINVGGGSEILPALEGCFETVEVARDHTVRVLTQTETCWKLATFTATCTGERLDDEFCTLGRVARLVVVISTQGILCRLRASFEFCDTVFCKRPVASAQEVGTEVTWLNAGDFDAQMSYLATERL